MKYQSTGLHRSNRKPLFKAWLTMMLVVTMALYLRMHQQLLTNSERVFPRTAEDSLRLSGRKAQEIPSLPMRQQSAILSPPPTASLEQTLRYLPDTYPPPAQGGVILFQHVVKTGGTTIRDNFKNTTRFPQVDYKEIFANSRFQKLQSILDSKLQSGVGFPNKTIFVEIHGRNTPTLVELAPLIQQWKAQAKQHQIPFYTFTLLRDPVDLAISFFNHFHVFGDERFGPSMPGTVENLRSHLQANPQCLYLFKGERAYIRPRHLYNVTAQDCQEIERLLSEVMDWVGDTRNLSLDTLPLLTYWVTGEASLSSRLESSNVADKRQQKHKPLSKKDVDVETRELIRSNTMLDQSLYTSAVTATDQLNELAVQ